MATRKDFLDSGGFDSSNEGLIVELKNGDFCWKKESMLSLQRTHITKKTTTFCRNNKN